MLVIIGFGLLSLLFAKELASGTPLARGVCGFIAIFWAARLVVQFFVFDAKPYLKTSFLKVGYHGLTVVFIFHVIVYSWAAIIPNFVTRLYPFHLITALVHCGGAHGFHQFGVQHAFVPGLNHGLFQLLVIGIGSIRPMMALHIMP